MRKSIHSPEHGMLVAMLRRARLEAGLGQADLSKKLGRSQSLVSDIETGKRRLDIFELRQICLFIGIPWIEFLQAVEENLPRRSPKASRSRP